MVGTDLNLSLPQLSDTLSVVVSKTATALSAIEDSLASKVTPAGMDISSNLDMSGNLMINAGGLLLTAATDNPAFPGLAYFYNGEWFLCDNAGAVQITSNGAVNASSIGGISGMSGGAAVSYDLASQEFRFIASIGVPADLSCDDVLLNGSAGSLRLDCGAGITTTRTFTFNELPASGVSVLVYDAGTSRYVDAQTTRATNVVKVTKIDVSGNVRHADRAFVQGCEGAVPSGSSFAGFSHANLKYSLPAGIDIIIPIIAPVVAAVSRIKKIAVIFDDNTLPSVSFLSLTGVSQVEVGPVVGVTVADTDYFTVATKREITINTPAVIGADDRLFVKILNNSGTALAIYKLVITYDCTL